MSTLLDDLAAVVDAVRETWSGGDPSELTPAELVAVNEALGRGRRLVDAAHARIASEISRQSRPEFGSDGLAKVQGYRNPTALIAATTGTSTGDAARLVKVGDATAPRVLLTGEPAPARRPHVAAAVGAGRIGAAAASAIITMLDRVALRAAEEAVDAAEQRLAEQAAGLTLDQLSKVLLRAEAELDPKGIEEREDEMRAERSLSVRQDSRGRIVVNGVYDPERGAPILVAIEGLVTAELRHQRDAESGAAGGGAEDEGGAGVPRRTIAQMRADALTRICEHALGCEKRDLPLEGATVIVRTTLAEMQEGAGIATIDGVDAPISISTARRMAADGGVIPCVLGGDSEILDWGRMKRLFTPVQKLALVERDGGCAMCGAPPGHAKVHHRRFWARDVGPTDLDNGVLLCEACHHRIHDNGWDIEIEGIGVTAQVWFVPPAHVDPGRTRRLGGRARYDYVA